MAPSTHSVSNKQTHSNFLSRLCLKQKFLLLIMMLLLPLALLFTQLVINTNATIQFSKQELRGVESIIPLRNLAQHLAEHRGMNYAFLDGNTSIHDKLLQKRKQVAADFLILDSIDARLGKILESSSKYAAIHRGWKQLLSHLNELSKKEATGQHTRLINKVLELISDIGDTSNLFIDPNLENAYLIDLIITRITHLTETTGIFRAKSSDIAARHHIDHAEKPEIFYLIRIVRELANGVDKATDTIISRDDGLGRSLANLSNKVSTAAAGFAAHVEKEILEPKAINVDSTQLFMEGTKAIQVANTLFDRVADILVSRLNRQISYDKKSAFLELLVLALFVSISLLIAWVIVRSITGPLNQTVRIFKRIGKGNYSNSIDVLGSDEISQLQSGLKTMQERLLQDRTEREKQHIEIARIKSALEYIDTPVTISNESGNLIFINKTGQTLFNEFHLELNSGSSSFDPESLMGTRIADFFNGDELERIFQALKTESHEAEFSCSGRLFRLNINPIFNSKGDYQGRITQWIEETEQKAVELEIQTVVDAAQDGDLSRRIDLREKSGFFLAFSRSINHLLEINASFTDELGHVLSSLAKGDLSKTVEGDYRGQFLVLKENTNETVMRLHDIIAELQVSAREITQGVREISTNNQELNSRTEEQASSLEQTASAMEEITSMVRNTADSVSTATELSNRTRELGNQGDEVLSQAIVSMEDIDHASHKIEKIIVVINEIAFQTNLLALNASVEAAHAGDQGKGFAVVATEVRNLAQRSAQAATEIKGLIEDSGEKVQQGSALVSDSGQALGEIVTSVNKVSTLLAEIENAGIEQSKGIGEVNLAITRIDTTTQSNKAMVQQTAAASQELEKHAVKLAELIEFFDVGEIRSSVTSTSFEGSGTDGENEHFKGEEKAWVA